MSEISVQFGIQKLNGYNKDEVDGFIRDIEEELQRRAAKIDALHQDVEAMQAQLEKVATPDALEAAEKIELYDKLMKKMDGDYNNLLAPAVAKAKAIQEQAERDYEIRMDQARATADGIYEQAAGRIADVVAQNVDQNMDRLYDLLDEFIYSKSLPGRVEAFFKGCNKVSMKVAGGLVAASKLPKKAATAVSTKVQGQVVKVKGQVGKVKGAIDTYKQKKAAKAEATEECTEESVAEA